MDMYINTNMDAVIVNDTPVPKAKTVSEYFDYVKDMKKESNPEELNKLAENTLSLLGKLKETNQLKLARQLISQYDITKKELIAYYNGFNIYVYREDIEKYIEQVAPKAVRIIELEKYERDIDDEAFKLFKKAKSLNIFDQYYVIFTDYTGEATKSIEKERIDKDPILFGAFMYDPMGYENPNSGNMIPFDRMYFIADWVDEYCDLTLKEMVKQYERKTKTGMVYNINVPDDVYDLKKYFGMIKENKRELKKDARKGFFKELTKLFRGNDE